MPAFGAKQERESVNFKYFIPAMGGGKGGCSLRFRMNIYVCTALYNNIFLSHYCLANPV